MTPQEQIEELAQKYDNLEAAYYANEKLSTFWPDKRVARIRAKDAHQVAANLRAIRFDSPQISEGMVEAGAVAMMGLSYQRWDSLYEMAKNISRIKSRACLSAALTQKGDSNG